MAHQPLLQKSGLDGTEGPRDIEMNNMEGVGIRPLKSDLTEEGKRALPATTKSFKTADEVIYVEEENQENSGKAGRQPEPHGEEKTNGEQNAYKLLLAAIAECEKGGDVSARTQNLIETYTANFWTCVCFYQLPLIAFAASLFWDNSLKAHDIEFKAAKIVVILLGIVRIVSLTVWAFAFIPHIRKSIRPKQPTLSKICCVLREAWMLDALEIVFETNAVVVHIVGGFGVDNQVFNTYSMWTEAMFFFWAMTSLPLSSRARYTTWWIICELFQNMLLPILLGAVAFNLHFHKLILEACGNKAPRDKYGVPIEGFHPSVDQIGILVLTTFALVQFFVIPAFSIFWDAGKCGRERKDNVWASAKLKLIYKWRLVCGIGRSKLQK